jgi:hypothetical protein
VALRHRLRLEAAAIGGNVAVADAAYETLMRGAATNLSNMETWNG